MALLAAALLFVPIGQGDLTTDGPTYAFVPLRAAATGEYGRLFLDWDGRLPYFNKPPVQFWLTALIYHVFDASVATARLATALSWLAAAALLYALVRPRLGTLAAASAAALLLVQREVFKNVLEARLDGGLIVGYLLASAAALKIGDGDGRRRWWLLVGVGVGFGLVYRGMSSLFGLGLVAAFLAWQRPGALRDWRGWLVLAGGLVVAGGWWSAWQWAMYGGEFAARISADAVGQHVEKAGGGVADFLDPYYLVRIPEAYWSALLASVAGVAVLRRDGTAPIARLAVVWVVGYLVVIHLTPIRGGRYTLPVGVGLCVIGAIGLTGFDATRRATARVLPWVGPAALGVASVLVLAGVPLAEGRDGALREAAAVVRPAVGVTRAGDVPADSPRLHVLADPSVVNFQKTTAAAFYTRARTAEVRVEDLRTLPPGDFLAVLLGDDRDAAARAALDLDPVSGDGRWRVYRVRSYRVR